LTITQEELQAREKEAVHELEKIDKVIQIINRSGRMPMKMFLVPYSIKPVIKKKKL